MTVPSRTFAAVDFGTPATIAAAQLLVDNAIAAAIAAGRYPESLQAIAGLLPIYGVLPPDVLGLVLTSPDKQEWIGVTQAAIVLEESTVADVNANSYALAVSRIGVAAPSFRDAAMLTLDIGGEKKDVLASLYTNGFPASADGTAGDVADEAALALVNDSVLDDHTEIWVATYRQWWILEKTSGAALVANEVIAAASGGAARWLRKLEADPVWTAQLAWFVSTTGDDENAGDAAAPLATAKEFLRRMRMWKASGGYVLNHDGLAVGDAIVPSSLLTANDTPVATGQILIVKGEQTSVLPSTTTGASTATNPTTSTQTTLIDAAVASFAPYVGKMIITAAGVVGIIAAGGVGVATVSEWWTPDLVNGGAGAAAAAPGAGVTYNIVDFSDVACFVDTTGAPGGQICFMQCHIPAAAAAWRARLGTLAFAACKIDKASAVHNVGQSKVLAHYTSFHNLGTVPGVNSGEWFLVGSCVIGSTFGTQSLSTFRISSTLFYASALKAATPGASTGHTGTSNVQLLGLCGFFEWTLAQLDAIRLDRMATMTIMGDLYGSSSIAGTNGVRFIEGARIAVLAAKTPTIAGQASQFVTDVGSCYQALELHTGALAAAVVVAVGTWAGWAAAVVLNVSGFARKLLTSSGSALISTA